MVTKFRSVPATLGPGPRAGNTIVGGDVVVLHPRPSGCQRRPLVVFYTVPYVSKTQGGSGEQLDHPNPVTP